MPGKSSYLENAFLKLVFNDGTIDQLASANTLYVGLHTGDPTDGGDQTSSEISYVNYERVPVARANTGWVVTANSASPVEMIVFPACGAPASNVAVTPATSVATYFSVGVAPAGVGTLLYTGMIHPTITVSSGVTPRLGTNTQITEG